MAAAYEDLLKDSSESFEDGNYFLITILDLELAQVLPIQFRYKYVDGTFAKDWSAAYLINTPALTDPNRIAVEFNDETTRAQFVGLVTPFLRDIQGRRGIYDFRVVCDTTNNTSQVIDSNQFVGDIYIKPARSINFIQLNFVAVRTGVDFTEVVGKF